MRLYSFLPFLRMRFTCKLYFLQQILLKRTSYLDQIFYKINVIISIRTLHYIQIFRRWSKPRLDNGVKKVLLRNAPMIPNKLKGNNGSEKKIDHLGRRTLKNIAYEYDTTDRRSILVLVAQKVAVCALCFACCYNMAQATNPQELYKHIPFYTPNHSSIPFSSIITIQAVFPLFTLLIPYPLAYFFHPCLFVCNVTIAMHHLHKSQPATQQGCSQQGEMEQSEWMLDGMHLMSKSYQSSLREHTKAKHLANLNNNKESRYQRRKIIEMDQICNKDGMNKERWTIDSNSTFTQQSTYHLRKEMYSSLSFRFLISQLLPQLTLLTREQHSTKLKFPTYEKPIHSLQSFFCTFSFHEVYLGEKKKKEEENEEFKKWEPQAPTKSKIDETKISCHNNNTNRKKWEERRKCLFCFVSFS
ncbi:hypothetical protein VP01_57g2 [Puccinia sorghi]|uniref:Uncharacterized protein n=1 Tax=Puccinia sorghi TaxID=27349 RepID=A0A0L6UIY2_9BASI|nr:hypothetical protein VP01_57g2 [Puccinia sorghi]